jgi:hypothetical protein
MRGLRVEAAEMLMHDLHFRLEHIVLLVGFAVVFGIALESGDFGVELTLGVLCLTDVFDG